MAWCGSTTQQSEAAAGFGTQNSLRCVLLQRSLSILGQCDAQLTAQCQPNVIAVGVQSKGDGNGLQRIADGLKVWEKYCSYIGTGKQDGGGQYRSDVPGSKWDNVAEQGRGDGGDLKVRCSMARCQEESDHGEERGEEEQEEQGGCEWSEVHFRGVRWLLLRGAIGGGEWHR